VVKDTPSSITNESENGEISTDGQDEEKVTPGDALSMNRPSEAPPTSVEELQNLAGGADIKVLKLDLVALGTFKRVLGIALVPSNYKRSFTGAGSCSRQGC
jgi:hypothetical protein